MSLTTLTRPQCDRSVVGLLTVFTLFRMWFAAHHQLVADESYYWQWSRHLAMGYYDNTPLMAWVIHAFVAAFGVSELTVRLGSVVSAVVASVFLYLLASRIASPQVGLVTVFVANVMLLFAAGAMLMTQDPVQLALWSAAAYVVWLAVEPGDTRTPASRFALWLVAGVLAGLTAMAKLNGILILLAVFGYLVSVPSARKWLISPAPYIAAIIAVAMLYPFWHWNNIHGHAFSLHAHAMATREYKDHNWPGRALIDYLGAQFLLLSPGFFLILAVTFYKYRPGQRDVDEGRAYLWWLAAVPLIVVCILSLKSRVEANWSVASYVTGAILIADWIVENSEAGKRQWQINASVAIALLISGFAVLFPEAGGRVEPKLGELYGWHEMADRIAAEQKAVGPSFVGGINYRMPSEAAFYLPGHPTTYSLFLNSRANEYMFWEDPNRLIGQNAILINDADDPKPGETDEVLPAAQAVFTRVEKQPAFKPTIGASNKPLRTVQIYRCYGFKGYDPAKWQDGW